MTGKRTQVAIRLTDQGLERIDQYAAEEERTRSDMIRKLLSEAIQQREMRVRTVKREEKV